MTFKTGIPGGLVSDPVGYSSPATASARLLYRAMQTQHCQRWLNGGGVYRPTRPGSESNFTQLKAIGRLHTQA